MGTKELKEIGAARLVYKVFFSRGQWKSAATENNEGAATFRIKKYKRKYLGILIERKVLAKVSLSFVKMIERKHHLLPSIIV